MTDFQREERYVVIKISKMHPHPAFRIKHLSALKREHGDALVDCVVVEYDWPEYEHVWSMIESRITGAPTLDHVNCHSTIRKQSEQIDRLRAQLAEAHAMLQDFADCPWNVEEATIPKAGIEAAPQNVVGTMHVGLMRLRRVRAWLSASAKPSAPKCKYCGDTGKIMVGRSGDANDGNAPILEPCEDCDRGAPVDRDELFAELAALEINGDRPCADIPDDHDEFLDANAHAALWLLLNVGRIRAALERKPS